MTAPQPPLWPKGWERESCGDADPDDGPRGEGVPVGYGRSPSRPRRISDLMRQVQDVDPGRWL